MLVSTAGVHVTASSQDTLGESVPGCHDLSQNQDTKIEFQDVVLKPRLECRELHHWFDGILNLHDSNVYRFNVC